MSEAYKKLIKTLQTIFEMDKADLDFGIYRIMNQKREEINRFLEHDLLPQVKEAFADYAKGGKSEVQAELDQLINTLTEAGMDPEQSPKVKELREKAKASVDMVALENEVYSHLHTFFSRYYDKGDFISQRRYKKDTYAIPYEGEEVKLYWANQDQYYIKSSEHLRDYAFIACDESGKTVRIKLVEADTEKDNVKAENGKERRFVLDADNPLSVENGELHIHFHYIPAGKKKQDALNKEAVDTLFKQQGFEEWMPLLKQKAPTEKNPDRTLLEKHLNEYTARNTFDYFIHKDLGGFLRRELDFYIKNEVLYLDDIDDAAFAVTEQHLRKIKVIRTIAHKIIRMLAQIEDFQKKLWLKKKFVVETNYCITLDRVPEELYPQVVDNQAQHREWFELGFIESNTTITEEYLKENPFLVLDTRFFDDRFKDKLLASIEHFDEMCNGLFIKGNNHSCLNLLGTKYQEKITSIYIDPPYNTGDDGFVYKDGFKSSTWISQMSNTTRLAHQLLDKRGSFFASCDEHQFLEFGIFLRDCFGSANHVETITWNKRVPKNDKGIGNIHEYIYLFAKDSSERKREDLTFKMRKDGIEEIYELVGKCKQQGLDIIDARSELKKFYKKQGYDRGITLYCELDPHYEIWGKINMSWPNAKTTGPRYEVISPVTGKPVPIPDNGWRWKEETFRQAEKDGPTYELPDGSMMVGRIWYSASETQQPSSIKYLKDVESFLLRSIISLKSDGSIQLANLNLAGGLDYPKPPKLMEWLAYSNGMDSGYYLDYFAGSGTTGQAILNLNREDNGSRRPILIDNGNHFDSVLLKRMKKIAFTSNWENGNPKGQDHISVLYKYQRIEGYEDTLNNLLVKSRTKQQEDLLEHHAELREDYMLGYWLELETEGSPSLLNIEQFEDPFNYKLNIATGSVGATKPTRVDLVETFNYLIGLTVKHIDTVRGFKVITGTNPKGESVLVIWRNLKEKDNAALEAFMDKSGYNPRDTEYEHIYVNGDHTLEDPHSKVKMIEMEFKRLMFDVRDV